MMMRFFQFLVTGWALTVSLFAAGPYPAAYSSIGDRVYIAAEGYEALISMRYFDAYAVELREYITEAAEVRELGLAVDATPAVRELRIDYVARLRKLETRRNHLDIGLEGEIKMLAMTYNVAALELLQANPYATIRNAALGDGTPLKRPEGVPPPVDLAQSLEWLKSRLMQLRESDAVLQQCYNDVTAINYWMLQAHRASQSQSWCEAAEAADQTVAFENAARRSCGDEEPVYVEWEKRSEPYRKQLRRNFRERCR
jgi:hypothetical protein